MTIEELVNLLELYPSADEVRVRTAIGKLEHIITVRDGGSTIYIDTDSYPAEPKEPR